jgi:hypothetical protein
MRDILERVDRMPVGTKLFFVGFGFLCMAAYNQVPPSSQFDQGQNSTPPPIVLRPDQRSGSPTEIPRATPFTAEAPYSASPSPAVEVRRGLAPDPLSPKWPDGKVLGHPRDVVRSHVVNVPPGEPLEMRAGPGTSFSAIAEIPFDAVDISQFTKDGVWDGDTLWYPVKWHGHLGYVGGGYLRRDH